MRWIFQRNWQGATYACLWLLILALDSNAAEVRGVSYSAHLYTSRGAPQDIYPTEKVPSFRCEEEIHLKIHWKKLPVGKHTATILWIDPQGDVAEQSNASIAINQNSGGGVSDYWLVVSRTLAGRLRHTLGAFDQTAWRVAVTLNSVPIISKPFWVRC